jgi:hypothetical protein
VKIHSIEQGFLEQQLIQEYSRIIIFLNIQEFKNKSIKSICVPGLSEKLLLNGPAAFVIAN